MLPTGGVIVPIHKLNTSIIPNCIAVIPIKSLVTTGRNIGVNINIAGVISINVPTTKSITLIISKITILLLLIPSKAFEIAAGIPVNAKIHAIILETPIRKTMIPVVSALSLNILYKSFIFIVL